MSVAKIHLTRPEPAQPTIVVFLLDRSSSMDAIKSATIEGFNGYLDGLQSSDAAIRFSFLQFDNISVDKVCTDVPVADARPLSDATYQPRGSTPLIDAAYETIEATARLAARHDGAKVVVCIQTDGEENCSRAHTWEQLNDLIKTHTLAGWQFNFMGAGIDAYRQAARMGIHHASTTSYDVKTDTTKHAFAAQAMNTSAFASGHVRSTAFSDAQKTASGDAFNKVHGAVGPAPAPINTPKPVVEKINL